MTRKEQKEARKWQIIRATLDLFVERGYYGTKTSQISKRADISEGLLFHYFPTKEILLEELNGVSGEQNIEKNKDVLNQFIFEYDGKEEFEFKDSSLEDTENSY